jgi:hypothetical protein
MAERVERPLAAPSGQVERRIERLRSALPVERLAGDLAELGLDLRLMPRRYAPASLARRAVPVWIAAGEPAVLRVGISEKTSTAALIRAAARALALARGFPAPGAEHSRAAEALVESFAYRYQLDLLGPGEALSALRRILARLSALRLAGRLGAAELDAGAYHAWAALSALEGGERAGLRRQLLRPAPGLARPLGKLEERLGLAAPGTGELARALLATIIAD